MTSRLPGAHQVIAPAIDLCDTPLTRPLRVTIPSLTDTSIESPGPEIGFLAGIDWLSTCTAMRNFRRRALRAVHHGRDPEFDHPPSAAPGPFEPDRLYP
jgi:hypothetical protein